MNIDNYNIIQEFLKGTVINEYIDDIYCVENDFFYYKYAGYKCIVMYYDRENDRIFYSFSPNTKKLCNKVFKYINKLSILDKFFIVDYETIIGISLDKYIYRYNLLVNIIEVYIESDMYKHFYNNGLTFKYFLFKNIDIFDMKEVFLSEEFTKTLRKITDDKIDYSHFAWGKPDVYIYLKPEYIEMRPELLQRSYKILSL